MEIVGSLIVLGVALFLAIRALRGMPDRRPPPHLRGDARSPEE